MACDICGDNTTELVALLESYQSRDIKQICHPCEKIVNEKMWKLRTVTGNILSTWLIRFMASTRAKRITVHRELTAATLDVVAERQRQVDVEGWTPEHDDEHGDGQMARAAAVYALYDLGVPATTAIREFGPLWPWNLSWLKPKGARRNLVRAAALLIAEIERLDRAAPPAG